MDSRKEFENLVFSGGGPKGIAYLGVLEQLERRGFPLSAIRRIAGTSAGAIMASLLAVGYELDVLTTLMRELDFKELLDEENGVTRDKVLRTNRKMIEEGPGVTTFFPAMTVSPKIHGRLREDGGVYKGAFLLDWLEEKLAQKTGVAHLTFAELRTLQQDVPETYRDLFVVAINLTTKAEQIFSADETPNVIISDAVRCSMSIPMLFEPHYFCEKFEGERVIDMDGDRYSDGGLTLNYPLTLFDNPIYMNSDDLPDTIQSNQRFINERTLGFCLKDFSKSVDDDSNRIVNRPNAKTFAKANAQTLYSFPARTMKTEDNLSRTVLVDSLGVSTFSFDITQQEIDQLIASGKAAVDNYLDDRSERLTYEDFMEPLAVQPLDEHDEQDAEAEEAGRKHRANSKQIDDGKPSGSCVLS